MEYKPRYQQPFTLAQAISFELSVIIAEIGRLQISLQHLRDTQKQLNEEIQNKFDAILSEAFKENEEVIASQEERILILRLALEHKGSVARDNSHYDLHQSTEANAFIQDPSDLPGTNPDVQDSNIERSNDGDGVYL
ncbi:hypothetical protein Clacol_001821 [Clathrus columnatus]|uniref:Uncharacterized protein n=1 Tax=Clathrus columnatus TaxID=1419009 RepID=A0AAV5A2F2_9AGAM|nr:hypothetical protein Clacol_001821 [Clathrus columnatus]